MKNFILNVGRFFIDFGVIIQIILIFVISCAVGFTVGEMNYDGAGIGFLSGIGTFIVLFTLVVMSNFLIYLILGMHDSFVLMSESLKIIAKNGTCSGKTKANKVNDNCCPECGNKFNAGDKFCEECGAKLD